MKICIDRVYFNLPQHKDLYTYPIFRDYPQQFYKIKGHLPFRYLKHVAEDKRTLIFVFPSLLLRHRAIYYKVIDESGKVTTPLLDKIVIYPVVKRNIYRVDNYFRTMKVDVIYAYVKGHTPYLLENLIKICKSLGRPYAYMYVNSVSEVKKIKKYDFEAIVLDAIKVGNLGAKRGYQFVEKIIEALES